MPLSQLIYVSRMTQKMDPSAVRKVAEHSESNNQRLDVTGALMCVGQHFMQLLEGDRDTVTQLFAKISEDPRHTDVDCLMTKSVNKRLFPQWGMRLLDPSTKARLDRGRLLRLLEEFQVHRNTGGTSVEARVLLQDFRQQLLDAA